MRQSWCLVLKYMNIFDEELEEEGEYTFCFGMAKLSNSPRKKGSARNGDLMFGVALLKALLTYSNPVPLDK